MTSRTSIHSYSGLAARAGLGGDVGRDLDRALVRLDVDHVPARHEVAGLGQRAVGGDRRGVRAAVAHPGLRRRERLRVDVLAVLLEQLADVPEEGEVRLHVLGGPLVHRREGMVRLRAAAVVLEEQVLRHGGLLVSWAAPVVALHLVSGAGQSFSTWNQHIQRPRTCVMTTAYAHGRFSAGRTRVLEARAAAGRVAGLVRLRLVLVLLAPLLIAPSAAAAAELPKCPKRQARALRFRERPAASRRSGRPADHGAVPRDPAQRPLAPARHADRRHRRRPRATARSSPGPATSSCSGRCAGRTT